MKSALRLAVILLLLALTALSPAWAQTQSTTGVIQGAIADENGAVVPGAAIVVANPATNFAKTAATDENGRFVFLQLQPGRYTLTASKQGYATVTQENLDLTVGQTIPLSLTMGNARLQARTAQPITPPVRTATNRNSLRKDNEFFSFDWRLSKVFRLGERFALVPTVEMFNTFDNKNLINPLTTPGLFNFDGFLRQGVGDPRQMQLALKFTF